MEKKESIVMTLFLTSLIAWLAGVGITPVGGWNENTKVFNPLYKQIFCISGSFCLLFLLLLLFIIQLKNKK